ncbi:MAG: 3-hydroxyacyl-CoA dehydrogenase family protein [Bacteroidales bacterium]|jgi:3-hydroxyacyl-CoA dehydrogenase|nr:3-hydroxyacyl-CoA dehydrogenase family protein [Bacteroidales bacterium]NCU36489.1 3-hydroxyacyl-CoA dehydrogenase family protein [Candidatus Falkowbacteria bacterium]MDD2633200.1 3-hydroxyacyl-CoA dehydrogenase family protein [Bacteroidales bacterium]MDD3131650.1 3-hydroxyacyl-CoA dehydrogenase family protein [Bacteroidales bacterium]MDD4177851.1 3-hydroxyacyl-CoA dehydrogenase family protein [Bacteroidales bacterium]
MTYDERLQKVSVLGAAGKMGSGILLLAAVEMADLSLKPENRDKTFVLNAIDLSEEGLAGLMKYLGTQVRKIAEKKVEWLRQVYARRDDLTENEAIVDEYISEVLGIVRPVTAMEAAYDSHLIFEAIAENPELKTNIFKKINENSKHEPWFFTNTSSIPITRLNDLANLHGRILGFHFYNPPAVQRLVELITIGGNSAAMIDFAKAYAKNLRKVVVPSNDVAGFIGNGHFMRDALHGIAEAEKLTGKFSFAQAVYIVNKVTQDFLLRPMGIFQLIDYVGIDVVRFIMAVMNPYHENENLHSPLLDKLFDQGVKGGQHSDGSQKDGFMKYQKGKPVAIYDIDKKQYVGIDALAGAGDEFLGALPDGWQPWKAVNFNKEKTRLLAEYFEKLQQMKTTGAEMAMRYLRRSREIGNGLVARGVAHNAEDVNTVMLTGFFHAYGPVNSY